MTNINPPLAGVIQPNGGLYSLGWYLHWNVGSNTATLDGEFTADDLEAIASHMREHQKQREPTFRMTHDPT